MGCNSSRARDAAAADARLETLKTPKLSRRLSKGAAFFAGGAVSPSVSKDDDQLEKLNLPLNGDILEDELITEEEQAFLRDDIEPRLGKDAAAILAAFDETSKARIGVPRPRRFARAFDREPDENVTIGPHLPRHDHEQQGPHGRARPGGRRGLRPPERVAL